MKIQGNLTWDSAMMHYQCFRQTLYHPCFNFVNLTNKFQFHVSICQSDRNTFQDHQESLTQIRDSNGKMVIGEKDEQEEVEENQEEGSQIKAIRMAEIEEGKA